MKRWHAFLIWLVGTLIAIAVIGENVYLGLLVAIGTGIVFGLVNVMAYRNGGANRETTGLDEADF